MYVVSFRLFILTSLVSEIGSGKIVLKENVSVVEQLP